MTSRNGSSPCGVRSTIPFVTSGAPPHAAGGAAIFVSVTVNAAARSFASRNTIQYSFEEARFARMTWSSAFVPERTETYFVPRFSAR